MTSAASSPVTREMLAAVYSRGRAREITIRLEGACLCCRLKGTRQTQTIDAKSVYMLAVRVTAEQIKRDRKAAREARRLERAG